MKFSVDTVSVIGDEHVRAGMFNQDYAYAHVCDHYGYIVVSDGCSRGARTDVGARIQSLAIATAIEENENDNHFSQETIIAHSMETVQATAKILHLTGQDLLATNLYGTFSQNGGHVYVRGDGVIVIGRRDGSWKFLKIEWAQNMPFYPAYAFSDQREHFVDAHGGEDAMAMVLEYASIDCLGEVTAWCERQSVKRGIQGTLIEFSDQEMRDITTIGLFSDGVTAISHMQKGIMPWVQVMQELVAFKNTQGVFLVRRVLRMLRDFAKQGFTQQDDLSGAVLIIEHDVIKEDSENG